MLRRNKGQEENRAPLTLLDTCEGLKIETEADFFKFATKGFSRRFSVLNTREINATATMLNEHPALNLAER